jgi:hypothetical protein
MDQSHLNSMTKSSRETSKLSLNEIIDENLTAMAALWTKNLAGQSGRTLIQIWQEALSELSPTQASAAFARLRKEFEPTNASPFPSPAHLLKLVDGASGNAITIEAESAWDHLLDWIRRFYSVDIGITKRATELDAKTWAASKAAGGLALLATCPASDLVWRKKEFIEFYRTIHETGKSELLLTDREAKTFVRQLAGGEIKGYIPPKPTVETELKQISEIVAEARGGAPPVASRQIPARPPFKTMTSTMSLDEQKEELRRRGFIA